MYRTSHRRRRRRPRAGIRREPTSALHLLTSRLLPLMVALAMCLVPMLASARDGRDASLDDGVTSTLEIEIGPDRAFVSIGSEQHIRRAAPGAEEWVPCADQGDGTRPRLCPSGAPQQARIDEDPAPQPLVEVQVQRASPCPGMAARRAAAADAQPCPVAQRRPCSRLGRTGRILIGMLLTWYALGMLLGVLLFMQRTLRDDDEEQRDRETRRGQ